MNIAGKLAARMINRLLLYLLIIFLIHPAIGVSQTRQIANSLYGKLIEEADRYRTISKFDSALYFLNDARALANQQKEPLWTAQVYNEIGLLKIYQGSYAQALTNLQISLSLYEDNEFETGISEVLNNIASVHFALKDFDLALKLYRKSLAIRLKQNNLKELGNSYNNMGTVYTKLGFADSALVFHQLSLKIWQELGNITGSGVTLSHIAGSLKEQGKLSEALDALLQSHEMLKTEKRSSRIVMFVQSEIGNLLIKLQRFNEAKDWCEGVYTNSKNANSRLLIQKSCECLYESYQRMGEYKKALQFYKEHLAIRDSMTGNEMTKDVTRLELNYAFDKVHRADSLRFVSERNLREHQVKQHRIGLVSIAGVLFLLAALSVSIYRGTRKSEELLLNILPKETAKELKKNGKSKARLFHSVSVLFTDFKGFTELSEQLTPQQLVYEINEYFSEFDRIMEKYGIEKIKTIGDSYMAAGGIPVTNKTHPFDIINAALEIQKFAKEYKTKRIQESLSYFEVRIGIHTGPVVAGIVGLKKFQYDIWGDTVNTASRMESSGEVGKVNISENTFELVKDQFTCTYRGEIEAKGKGKIKMYFVDESA
jgi:adenylate cyclase